MCLEGDREFGVVLIERGSEVGGADVRSTVGTVAHIVEASELPDGRWVLGAVGGRRVQVERWLPDDPFPIADVVDYDDGPSGPDGVEAYAGVVVALRRVLALCAELGDATVDATIDLSDEPELGSFQVAAVGPWGPADQYDLLALPSAEARLERLAAMLVEEEAVARARLDLG